MRNRIALLLMAALPLAAQKYNLGRPATADEVKAADIGVLIDGTNLPPGKGTAAEGKEVFARRCAKCHGSNAQGGDEAPLVGGKGTLTAAKPLKTIGSFWPYATTLYDYINRAMPFNQPGILTADQVYAVTAYLLQLNGIVSETDVLDAKSLPKVRMPNRDGFVKDARPDTKKGAVKPIARN
jgi:cytochrome c